MHLLVTRPEPDGERTASQLRARGHQVMLAPLLRMEAVAADLEGGDWHALTFTSANAVRAVAGHPRLKSLLGILAYAVGGRTADAACGLGFENVISADGDASDLARLMKLHLRPGRALDLAGEQRSGDLGGELGAAGIDVSTTAVYRAVAATALPAEAQAGLTAGRLDGVLHFSRRSSVIYIAACASLRDAALAPTHFCLSRQVAEPLEAAGATRVLVAKRPREPDLIDLVTP